MKNKLVFIIFFIIINILIINKVYGDELYNFKVLDLKYNKIYFYFNIDAIILNIIIKKYNKDCIFNNKYYDKLLQNFILKHNKKIEKICSEYPSLIDEIKNYTIFEDTDFLKKFYPEFNSLLKKFKTELSINNNSKFICNIINHINSLSIDLQDILTFYKYKVKYVKEIKIIFNFYANKNNKKNVSYYGIVVSGKKEYIEYNKAYIYIYKNNKIFTQSVILHELIHIYTINDLYDYLLEKTKNDKKFLKLISIFLKKVNLTDIKNIDDSSYFLNSLLYLHFFKYDILSFNEFLSYSYTVYILKEYYNKKDSYNYKSDLNFVIKHSWDNVVYFVAKKTYNLTKIIYNSRIYEKYKLYNKDNIYFLFKLYINYFLSYPYNKNFLRIVFNNTQYY